LVDQWGIGVVNLKEGRNGATKANLAKKSNWFFLQELPGGIFLKKARARVRF